MTLIIDDIKVLTVTHGGQSLEEHCTMKLPVEEVAIMAISGQLHLVLKGAMEVPPRPEDPEGTSPQRLTVLVGSRGPGWEMDNESPEQLRAQMDAAREWRQYLNAEGAPGNVLWVHAASTTPYIFRTRSEGEERSEWAAYYECVSVRTLERAADREAATAETA